MIKGNSIQFLIVLCGSLLIGMVYNQFNSGGIPLFASTASSVVSSRGSTLSSEEILSKKGRTLTLAEAFVLHETQAAVFIDARPPSFYKVEHIKNAVSIYYKNAGLNPVLESLKKNDPFVVYCSNSQCNQAQVLITTMQKAGFTKIFLFSGGMKEWRLSQYPMDRTPK